MTVLLNQSFGSVFKHVVWWSKRQKFVTHPPEWKSLNSAFVATVYVFPT